MHSGSWVDGNFTTWIGDSVKNRAWDLLSAAREMVAKHPEATPEIILKFGKLYMRPKVPIGFGGLGKDILPVMMKCLIVCSVSIFVLFIRALDEPIPIELEKSVERHDKKGDRVPQGFIHPIIDGIGDEQDWDRAGLIEIGGAQRHDASQQCCAKDFLWFRSPEFLSAFRF